MNIMKLSKPQTYCSYYRTIRKYFKCIKQHAAYIYTNIYGIKYFNAIFRRKLYEISYGVFNGNMQTFINM